MKSRILALTVLALCTVVERPALAADPPADAKLSQARDHFTRGVQLYRDRDYGAALVEFKRANEIAASYRIQFNIAEACVELRDYACAYRAFETFLRSGGDKIPDERRQLSEREISRLKKYVARIRITSNKRDADVSIDDEVVGHTPVTEMLIVGAGRHRVTVSLAPLVPVTRIVEVAGGDEKEISFELADPTPPQLLASVPAPRPSAQGRLLAPPPNEKAESNRTPFWIGLVATGTLVTSTALSGALTLSAKSHLDATAGRLGSTADDVDSARSTTRTLRTATDILLVSSLVAAGITTWLLLSTKPGASPAATGKLAPVGSFASTR